MATANTKSRKPLSGVSNSSDGLSVEIDFGARYGHGLHLGVSLGGGGLFFVAWQIAYLSKLASMGIDLGGAQRVVGTSAGSVVAAVIEAGHLGRFEREISLLGQVPKLMGALAPASKFSSSQQRALDLFVAADHAEPELIKSIGHAALAANTPNPSVMSRNVGLLLASVKWPSSAFHATCVDAFTGERCVVTADASVRVTRAVAASSAVPGIFSPQPIGDRRCMDGGVSGSGVHTDLLAGCERVVVLSLSDGSAAPLGGMTIAPGSIQRELAALKESGSEVFFRVPDSVDLTRLMDPTTVPDALAMGRRQAEGDAESLRAFIKSRQD
jgi:NTE family protein